MKITILCVGKIKEKFYRDAIAEYSKRLGSYCRLEFAEFADEKTKEQSTEHETSIVKQKEGERLLKSIKDDGYVICLAIDGKMMDSIELSQTMEKLAVSGVSHIYFVIGGSLGLSDEVLRRADLKLSFSKMTFPHQLMRVILLEQIYRSYRIINGEPYHK
jgi:23S rRNA (pseudouridine1915-N3)-methyltransferase